jgi:hypothetical protein
MREGLEQIDEKKLPVRESEKTTVIISDMVDLLFALVFYPHVREPRELKLATLAVKHYTYTSLAVYAQLFSNPSLLLKAKIDQWKQHAELQLEVTKEKMLPADQLTLPQYFSRIKRAEQELLFTCENMTEYDCERGIIVTSFSFRQFCFTVFSPLCETATESEQYNSILLNYEVIKTQYTNYVDRMERYYEQCETEKNITFELDNRLRRYIELIFNFILLKQELATDQHQGLLAEYMKEGVFTRILFICEHKNHQWGYY